MIGTLIKYDASIVYKKNKAGMTPLNLCENDKDIVDYIVQQYQ